jgi:tetratricopeptide (TPR) repeat protein
MSQFEISPEGRLEAAKHHPQLMQAALALGDNDLPTAEQLLRDFLKKKPTDVAAIRMLGELATRLGRYADAGHLLSRCLELAPDFTLARYNLALVLHRQNESGAALQQLEVLLRHDAGNPSYLNMKAAVLVRIGDYAQAIGLYDTLLQIDPNQPKGWMSYGHALKTVGRQADSITAYQHSLQLEPSLGEAWWSLANLKTFRFEPSDIETMQTQIDSDTLSEEDRFHLHFALGKALEDAAQYETSFRHYAAGNAQRRTMIDYSADRTSATVERMISLFTPAFLQSRAGDGHSAADPIFILGLPRSGSTLIEQILASHSQVEGTMELPDIISMVQRVRGDEGKHNPAVFAETLAGLSAAQREELGAEYIARTRVQRKTTAPFFIDKMPNNWIHAGFIHLILPNAKIIDARRHPLGCCFSGYKQHFARGQNFSYDLNDIGRYYADYVQFMAHLDKVLPGRIHRVFYEQMVDHTEIEIRRLLDYCGLAFEPACLSFYKTQRAVRTASSEQVRQPIFKSAVEHWQQYEAWLGPLKSALGPALKHYPRPV